MIQIEPITLQYSKALEEQIIAKIIANGGKISFSDYMQQILYAPGLGYYNCGTTKFGSNGDFITAPELGSIFAKCIANQIGEILSATNTSTIFELGAGSGQLVCDLLLALESIGINVTQYLILELSPDLRYRQQELIQQQCPQFASIVQWLDHLPSNINGVIFANEVMDAMPVARFNFDANRLSEYYVQQNNNNFVYVKGAASPELQKEFIRTNIAQYISQPYSSEINLFLSAWINSLSACLTTGAILLCDYGFTRAEYYHPQRNEGTLMCHYQHRCHSNPFINIGLQDVTAHVDFTTIAEAADENDLSIAGYTNLTSFLLNCDLTSMVDIPSVQQSHEINVLTSPAEMGELFKCMALLKGVEIQLRGFKQFDKIHCL